MLLLYGLYLFFQLSSHAYISRTTRTQAPVALAARGEAGFQQVVLAAAHANRLPPFDGSYPELEEDDDDEFVLGAERGCGLVGLIDSIDIVTLKGHL